MLKARIYLAYISEAGELNVHNRTEQIFYANAGSYFKQLTTTIPIWYPYMCERLHFRISEEDQFVWTIAAKSLVNQAGGDMMAVYGS